MSSDPLLALAAAVGGGGLVKIIDAVLAYRRGTADVAARVGADVQKGVRDDEKDIRAFLTGLLKEAKTDRDELEDRLTRRIEDVSEDVDYWRQAYYDLLEVARRLQARLTMLDGVQDEIPALRDKMDATGSRKAR